MTHAINIYEDNSGAVYLGRGSEIWQIGPVTPDLYGCVAEDAEAWATGDWEPNESDGQVRLELDDHEDLGLALIATWSTDGGLDIKRNGNGDVVAGAGGSDFLGLDAKGQPTGPMTAATFKATREFLGLTTKWLAATLNVQERTVQRWDSGATPVPAWVRYRLQGMKGQTENAVESAIEQCRRTGGPYITYRTDSDYHSAEPDVEWPASWHRAVGARVVHELSGLTIEFHTPD